MPSTVGRPGGEARAPAREAGEAPSCRRADGGGGGAEGLVSVVLPTAGRPAFLHEAVASVVAQSYEPIELLVVDGSTSSNADVVSAAGADSLAAVRYLRDDGGGVAAARNRAIRAAAGEFVAFIDDDDRWAPAKLRRQVAAFRERGPAVGLVYTGQRYVDGAGDQRGRRTPTTRGAVARRLVAGAPLCPFSSVMVRARAIDEAGLLDERFPVWEDREWYLRLSRHCLVEAIPEPLVARRVGDHDQLTDDYEQLRDVALPLFLQKHAATAAELGPGFDRRLEASLSMAVATRAFAEGRRDDAVRFALRSIRNDPFAGRRYLYLPLFVGGRPARRVARRLRGLWRVMSRISGSG